MHINFVRACVCFLLFADIFMLRHEMALRLSTHLSVREPWRLNFNTEKGGGDPYPIENCVQVRWQHG